MDAMTYPSEKWYIKSTSILTDQILIVVWCIIPYWDISFSSLGPEHEDYCNCFRQSCKRESVVASQRTKIERMLYISHIALSYLLQNVWSLCVDLRL